MGYSATPINMPAMESETWHGLGALTTLSQQQTMGGRFTRAAMYYRDLQAWAARLQAGTAAERNSPAGVQMRNELGMMRNTLNPLMARMLSAARRAKARGLVDDQGGPTPAGTQQLGVLHGSRPVRSNSAPASSLTVPLIVAAIIADDLAAYVYALEANPADLAAFETGLAQTQVLWDRIDWQWRSASPVRPGGGGGSTTSPGKPPRLPSRQPVTRRPTGRGSGSGGGSAGSGSGSGGGGRGSGSGSGRGLFNVPPWMLAAGVGVLALAFMGGGRKK